MYIFYLFLVLTCISLHLLPSEGLLYNYVTCGSVIKLQHVSYNVRLHSHEVQYGSGSGQQSVTAIEEMDDVNSHWVIKSVKDKHCQRGKPVECGSTIRFEHLITKRNLHSHYFTAPLSHGQEVSAFGKEGEGDTGDNWNVMCDGDSWQRDNQVMFKHADTNMYLSISGQTFGHPIPGQMEVYAVSEPETNAYWKVNEGIFVKPSEFQQAKDHIHTEL